jgi:sulfur-oxidizing protein SoxB
MNKFDRRDFIKMLGAGAAASSVPAFWPGNAFAQKMPANFYNMPMKGNARILHITDVHGQLLPVYFREPNVNLGVGDAYGRPPHVVGKKLLKHMDINLDSPESYAYSYINFLQAARQYGKTGGYPQIKSLLDMLRLTCPVTSTDLHRLLQRS